MVDKNSPAEFITESSTRIERRVGLYTRDHVDEFLNQWRRTRRRVSERTLLDRFTHHVELIGASYDPPAALRNSDRLVFKKLYDAALHPPGQSPAGAKELLAALLAAEVEFRNPAPLTRVRCHQLAETYERLGKPLQDLGLPGHAALAFRRASGLYRLDEDPDAEDRCGLALSRAKRLAQPARWRRIGGLFPDLVCGYGYRPFRMLAWIVLQLALFWAVIFVLGDKSWATTLYQVTVDYLNPLGPGDTEDAGTGIRVLYVLESYLGTVTLSVFFALLVRRWFRL